MLYKIFSAIFLAHEATLVIFGLILLLFFHVIDQAFGSQQVSVAELLAQHSKDMQVAGSNPCQIFHVTPICLLVQLSVGPFVICNGLWSKLSFSSPELLAHAVGCRFESCQWLLFLYLYSVYTNKKKLSHPSSLS